MTEQEYTREELEKFLPKEHIELYLVRKKFKVCPFCGKAPKTYIAIGGYVVGCNNEECDRFTMLNRDLEELLKRWNRRDG